MIQCKKDENLNGNAGNGTEENNNAFYGPGGGGSLNGAYEYPAFYPIGPFGMPMPMPFSPFGIGHHHLAQPHTLERFAFENFRQPTRISGEFKFNQKIFKNKTTIWPDSIVSECSTTELWRHSRDPLNAPLLKRLALSGKEELIQEVPTNTIINAAKIII
jgi:hypothetical protein